MPLSRNVVLTMAGASLVSDTDSDSELLKPISMPIPVRIPVR